MSGFTLTNLILFKAPRLFFPSLHADMVISNYVESIVLKNCTLAKM